MSDFLYRVPDHIDELSDEANLVMAVGSMASQLTRVLRTHVDHPGGRAENVAEHCLMLVKVAVRLAQRYYPELNAGLIAIYAADHDDVEAYVGDTPTDRITEEGLRQKQRLEARAVEQLSREFGTISPEYARDVQTYEQQLVPEARFVRLVDKILTLVIHFDDNGQNLYQYFSQDHFLKWTIDNANRFTTEYPEFADVVALRTEIAMYLYRKYYLAGHKDQLSK